MDAYNFDTDIFSAQSKDEVRHILNWDLYNYKGNMTLEDHIQTIVSSINTMMLHINSKYDLSSVNDILFMVGGNVYDDVFSRLMNFNKSKMLLGRYNIEDGGEFEPDKILFVMDGEIIVGELIVGFDESSKQKLVKIEEIEEIKNKKSKVKKTKIEEVFEFPTISPITSTNLI